MCSFSSFLIDSLICFSHPLFRKVNGIVRSAEMNAYVSGNDSLTLTSPSYPTLSQAIISFHLTIIFVLFNLQYKGLKKPVYHVTSTYCTCFTLCLNGNDIDRKSTRLNSSHVSISYAV